MIEDRLDGLEVKIDKLIESLRKIKLENTTLRKKVALLNGENVSLLDKKKRAAESVKGLINQLQDELLCQIPK